jgi:uncharacterized protein YdhG (YjbR/CyaY superfamily)
MDKLPPPRDVDAYIAGFPPATGKLLERVRTAIKLAAPGAEERISYAIPAFRLAGENLVYFAGYDKHIGFYATPTGHAAFQHDYAAYKTGKGSVQFPLDKPLPLKLIAKIVKFRVKECLAMERRNRMSSKKTDFEKS